MVEMMKREALASHWWWFDSHNTCKHSPWLQSTLEGIPNLSLISFVRVQAFLVALILNSLFIIQVQPIYLDCIFN